MTDGGERPRRAKSDKETADEKTAGKKNTSAPKVPRKITQDRLRNIALYHLERFATSADNLRRVLYRRVLKAARHHETDLEQARTWIDDLVTGLVRSGAVDDARYAEGKARSMARRGQSQRNIQAYLASKGVDRATAEAALASLADDSDDPELDSAHAYAARRRIGPYRVKQAEEDQQRKDLAALGRAGFSYDVARRLLESEPRT
jgi:regulatory protein